MPEGAHVRVWTVDCAEGRAGLREEGEEVGTAAGMYTVGAVLGVVSEEEGGAG